MNTFISMLRGINVSGQKKIKMADLKSRYEALGLGHVTTYVQSGNVVFESAGQDGPALAYLIEGQIQQTFGYDVRVFVRTPDDFQKLIETNLFLNSRHEDPARLHVTFLYSNPPASVLSGLELPSGISDEFFLAEKAIFLFCPNGYGTTKLSNTFFERKLKTAATTRNWNTVNALYQLAKVG
jgi:uncharacterized protein (DUF1697 family)